MPKPVEVIGRKFGFWTVVEFVYSHSARGRMYKCRCDCGKEVIKSAGDLSSLQDTASCGCKFDRKVGKKYKDYKTRRLRKIFNNVRSRCNNSNATAYDRYGGRGITVCEEWKDDFFAFRDWALENGYADELTLDRINNDGPYSPDNCRWLSKKGQMRNMSRNRIIRGKTVAEWSEELGIANWVLRNRILRGWSEERVLSEPVHFKPKISDDQICINKSMC